MDLNLYDKTRIRLAERWASTKIKQMSLRQKIGQLIVVRLDCENINIDGDYISEIVECIKSCHISGFYISATGPYEAAMMGNYLQSLSQIPLIISADFEFGAGRLIRNATVFPRNMLIGATHNPANAFESAKITALEARRLGVSVLFSPVADVNNNPQNPIVNIRSFGSEPEFAGKFTAEYVRGAQRYGAAATLKHFPGHGDTATDSHIAMPQISADKDTLLKRELIPFQAGIEAGTLLVMTAHISVPHIEPDTKIPASLSYNVTTKLLREEMGFSGVVCTDGMDMHAITHNFSIDEAATLAVSAGADFVLISPDTKLCYNGLISSVKKRKISEERINQSVFRILRLKALLGLHKERTVDVQKIMTEIGSRKNLNTAKKIYDAGITLVKNDERLLPFGKYRREYGVPVFNFYDNSFWELPILKEVSKQIGLYTSGSEEINVGCEISNERMNEILGNPKIKGGAILNIFIKVKPFKGSVALSNEQLNLIKNIAAINNSTVALVFGSPYLISEIKDLPAIVAVYDHSPEAIRAAYKALFGKTDFMGRLPVEIPGCFQLGHSLKSK